MIFLNRDNAGIAAVCGAIFLAVMLAIAVASSRARADVVASQEELVPVPRSIVERTAGEMAGMAAMIEALAQEVAKRDRELEMRRKMSCA